MPWRNESDVYKIWLSEIMLQQTKIETAIPYYKCWIKRFPTLFDVASATEDEVLKYWEGLGYYARVRNFRNACKDVVKNYRGVIPNNKDFIRLKGVGDYIDAAVRSIAYKIPLPVIDGNVKRVISRILMLKKIPDKCINQIRAFLYMQISKSRPGDFNQGLMDLGRLICKPQNPLCSKCPISKNCLAFVNNSVNKYPIKKKKVKIPHYIFGAGLIWKNNELLISKRNSDSMLGGLWEFPGGKKDSSESIENCIKRKIKKKLNIAITIHKKLKSVKHSYSHFQMTLYAYHCKYKGGSPKAIECANFKWISPEEINSLAFHKANHKLFNQIPAKNPCI